MPTCSPVIWIAATRSAGSASDSVDSTIRQALRLHFRDGITAPQEVAPLAADRLDVDVLARFRFEETRGGFQ